jgi:purine-binding chemotaxis protein CheW
LTDAAQFLVCRVLSQLCALPIAHVGETMRPLPVVALASAVEAVRGVAIIRGAPVPVVHLAGLLAAAESPATRFVTVSVAGRCVALEVDEVVGVRTLPAASLQDLPPLLRDAGTDTVVAMGTLDAQLLIVLNSARLIPDAVWLALETGEATP